MVRIVIKIGGKSAVVERFQTTPEVSREFPALGAALRRSEKSGMGYVRKPAEKEPRLAYQGKDGEWMYAERADLASQRAESRDEARARRASMSRYRHGPAGGGMSGRDAGGSENAAGNGSGNGTGHDESRAPTRAEGRLPVQQQPAGTGPMSDVDRELGICRAVYNMFETPAHQRRFLDLVMEAISGKGGEGDGA